MTANSVKVPLGPPNSAFTEVQNLAPSPSQAEKNWETERLNWISRIEKETEHRYQEAQKKGYADGLAQALTESKTQHNDKLVRLEKLATSLTEERKKLQGEVEDAVVELTLIAVYKLIGDNPTSAIQLRNFVQQAIIKADYLQTHVTVHVSPADYELLSNAHQQSETQHITWQADSRVALGGCILQSPRGHLDLRLEKRLERLKESLLEQRQQARTA